MAASANKEYIDSLRSQTLGNAFSQVGRSPAPTQSQPQSQASTSTSAVRWTNNIGAPGFGPEDYDDLRRTYSDQQIKDFLTSNASLFGQGKMNVSDQVRSRLGLGTQFSNTGGRPASDFSQDQLAQMGAQAQQYYDQYRNSLNGSGSGSTTSQGSSQSTGQPFTFNNDGVFSTVPGQLSNSGLQTLVDLANRYKDNETIGGLALGAIADASRTQINTSSSIAYNDAFLSSLGRYQQGVETLKAGNAMQLMGAEGRIQKDLQNDALNAQKYGFELQRDSSQYTADRSLQAAQEQASAQRYGYEQQAGAQRYGAELGLKGTQEQAAAQRYGYEQQAGAQRYGAELGLQGTQEQAAAQRYGYEQQAGAQRYSAELGLKGTQEQASAQRYGYEQQAGAQRYSAELGLKGTEAQASAQRYGYEKQAEATKYGADRGLEGTKYQSDSSERQIGLTGEEQRKTLGAQTEQQLALRRDARGAIASAGRRFYG